jgi:Haem-degrading
LTKPKNAFLKQIPGVAAVGGWAPLKAGNEIIGGVGVSGSPGGDKDEETRASQRSPQPFGYGTEVARSAVLPVSDASFTKDGKSAWSFRQ